MKSFVCALTIGLGLLLLPWTASAQSTDRSEMNQWLKMTQNQKDIPVGTIINMSNWRQYQDVMPLGMIKLFEGQYNWKMPADVQITVGPSRRRQLA